MQNAENYASTADDTKIDTYFQELETSRYGNTVAKSLSTFVSKTKSNGGYYLARYEASYKDATHCYSKVSTTTRGYTEEGDGPEALTSGMLWTSITQPDAAEVARNSFSNSFVESDLVNSYGWDTAIVFIQTYSGDNDYSKETGPTFNGWLANTGTNGDKRCNIYDMASNTSEWTTETFAVNLGSSYYEPCTIRGGFCLHIGHYTAGRSHNRTSSINNLFSFRSLLYIK